MVKLSSTSQRPFGKATITSINWEGLYALYVKEVRRFFKVQMQTIWAPVMSTLLFLVIFTVALGGGHKTLGWDFAAFVAPGLIAMGMMQNAFANASFSLLVGKMQGTILDYLIPPIGSKELIAALLGAAMTRAFLVGFFLWLAMAFWPHVHYNPMHIGAVFLFGFLGAMMLALIGLLTSVWADKYDHAASVSNFIIQPLALLSGTFYSVHSLHGLFYDFSTWNPFFHVISGFRYGFIDVADANVTISASILIAVNIILSLVAYFLIARGWKLKS
ncbi:MAG: ABC transporter permease [Zymomonas mobilis subsp. pomaceae]|uniref:Transport permease protein n=1 Tax=Zymomonas mobilis subsp. pomaceae (strain ATCC 29192 / DSM 22645 / JCM 10191 / CCUG 17912 / NBRC 13757 / NCIMB 11200 / NRRL B-4491 / Barker I) TaxID=579138 RepID=F8ESC7_ZYMMT|nr:ABC transporter permease [Zymomonas mobilis]AEI37702.1 ABC-2 type transporter [Zymomonas mobilis subsp. pomaceae ATCC 29192]MDX5949069.1 ABC transporter permease [Zymomonas mobilis subsp. pomaceae]GEB88874.1 transport permease protein [Zymomonas mobilis subsp. pomaceae]